MLSGSRFLTQVNFMSNHVPFLPLAFANKAQLRQKLRQQRKNLPTVLRQKAEQRINAWAKKEIKRGKHIGVYWAVGSELCLNTFIQAALKRGACVYLPYIEAKQRRLWFTPYPQHSGSLKKWVHNIPQYSGKKIRAHRLHLLFVPLVGLDKQGYRLGQGGGYYDCTLAACQYRLQPKTIAAAFACQTVQQLPYEAHDCRVNAWIGEYGYHRFSGSKK